MHNRYSKLFIRSLFVVLLCLAGGGAAQAKNAEQTIQKPMVAVNTVTLQTAGTEIRLWGIKPAAPSETVLDIHALDLMDRLIGQDPVVCHVVDGAPPMVTARCTTSTGDDLGLALLQHGYARVDRHQTYNSVFASTYAQAQQTARSHQEGIWRLVSQQGQTGYMPQWLKPLLPTLLPLALVFGPFLGLFLIALVAWRGLARIGRAQEQEYETLRRKERALQTREKLLLITALEGELIDNKNKIDAFVTIYEDMMSDLRGGAPKYQQGGDTVQRHPSLSRGIFDANMSRLSLLDIKLSGILSRLYAAFPPEPEYVSLEPDVPLDTAVKLVEKVLAEAQELQKGIDTVIAMLQRATESKAAAPAK